MKGHFGLCCHMNYASRKTNLSFYYKETEKAQPRRHGVQFGGER